MQKPERSNSGRLEELAQGESGERLQPIQETEVSTDFAKLWNRCRRRRWQCGGNNALVSLLIALALTGHHVFIVHGFLIQQQLQVQPWVTKSGIPSRVLQECPLFSAAAENNDYFSIETSYDGPANGAVHRLRFHRLPGIPDVTAVSKTDDSKPTLADDGMNVEELLQATLVPPPLQDIVIETGRIGRQAAGAITLSRGDTVLYSTACRDDKPKEDLDFAPLSVEYQERFSSAGLTSGAYNKRDGRAAEHEILTCRLIDRPIRPLIGSTGWKHETQLLTWVLSYDGERSCDSLAVTSSAAALYLSDIPLSKPVAAVEVGMDPVSGEFWIFPTNQQMEQSALHLTVAGTKDAVLMIKGAAEFLPEETMIQAVQAGHDVIQVLCDGIAALGEKLGIVKNYSTIVPPTPGLQDRVNQVMQDRVDAMFAMSGQRKEQFGQTMSQLSKDVITELAPEFEDVSEGAIKSAFKTLLSNRLVVKAKTEGLRCDGRSLTEVRRLDMTAGFLPRTHGSALFTRGETQTIATATLGDSGMRQKIDSLDGLEEKRFYLQYTFPPSSVGETGRVGAPGRREVGHGNLAERALVPTLPSEIEFPYTIRVESLITESNGSSSMASVCGGCLALMDAGVPIKSPVAGIAMGMLLDEKSGLSDESAVILSDILGAEDALGTMDFKVAGNRVGITTFQLDIKCEGLTIETMKRALAQAREGRLHILDEMEKVLAAPRDELPASVPRMATFQIPYETIGRVIGPGGKQIRAIIDDFKLVNMDVDDSGRVQVTSYSTSKLAEAEAFVMSLVGSGTGSTGGSGRKEKLAYAGPDPVEGEIYTGKITGIHQFGVFVEILPGAEDGSTPGLEGLVHVSELAKDRIRNCEGFMKSMGVDELTVKYLGKEKGKIKLSRKAALESQSTGLTKRRPTPLVKSNGIVEPAPTMSKEELDVIAHAIEELSDR
jgi:polyribonucleotide nucleotidyltransferase